MQISIITPSYNQREYLHQTLNSVLHQQGPFDLQHLVIDGQSTDGSVELLRSISDPRLTWTSQPDTGQSDAINRGLRQASGDIVGWLNSDDLYTPGALAIVAGAFEDPAVNWVVGRYQIIDPAGRPIRSAIARYKERSLTRYTYARLLRENFIAQPSVFWRNTFGQQAGLPNQSLLDQSLHYTMDYDLWLRMGKLSPPLILDHVLSQFRIHPQSKSGKVNRQQFDEGYQVARRYFAGDRVSQAVHRFNVEKIVLAYRLMRWLGR